MNATIKLEKSFISYHSLLVYSMTKMSKMIADFNNYGDTHCSCEGGRATTSTTSGSDFLNYFLSGFYS